MSSCSAPSSSSSSSPSAPCAPSVAGAKFYYMSGSCASAAIAVAQTLGLKGMQLEQVDLRAHKTQSGKDFYAINPKGNVPYLVLPNGSTLNENAAVLQFLADQKPEAALAGAWGTMDRYTVQNSLNHLSSEVHPALHLWTVQMDQKEAEYLIGKSKRKLAYVDKELQGKKYYVLDRFTVADCYLYFLLNWVPNFAALGVKLDDYPNVKSYHQHIGQLPQMQATIKLMQENPNTIQ